MSYIEVFVPGVPVPQGSKRALPVYEGRGEARRFTGRVVVADSAGQRLAEWRSAVIHAVRAKHAGGPLEGPLVIRVSFLLPRPQRPRFTVPATRPDWDKLARAVCDALQAAGLFRDDGQIVSASVSKRYAADGLVGAFIYVAEAHE